MILLKFISKHKSLSWAKNSKIYCSMLCIKFQKSVNISSTKICIKARIYGLVPLPLNCDCDPSPWVSISYGCQRKSSAKRENLVVAAPDWFWPKMALVIVKVADTCARTSLAWCTLTIHGFNSPPPLRPGWFEIYWRPVYT